MQQVITETYFTWAMLGTLAGASTAVVVVGNTMRKLLKVDSPWVGFVTSLAVVFGVAIFTEQLTGLETGVLAFLNSCLLFCTALGINDTTNVALSFAPGPYGKSRDSWISAWLKRT